MLEKNNAFHEFFYRHERAARVLGYASVQRQMRKWREDGSQNFMFESLYEFHELLHSEDWGDRCQYQEDRLTKATLLHNDQGHEILVLSDDAIMRVVRNCTHLYIQQVNAVRPEFGFETIVLQITAIVKNHVSC